MVYQIIHDTRTLPADGAASAITSRPVFHSPQRVAVPDQILAHHNLMRDRYGVRHTIVVPSPLSVSTLLPSQSDNNSTTQPVTTMK